MVQCPVIAPQGLDIALAGGVEEIVVQPVQLVYRQLDTVYVRNRAQFAPQPFILGLLGVVDGHESLDQLPPRLLREGVQHRIFIAVGLGLLAVYPLPVDRLGVREGDIVQVGQLSGLGHQHRRIIAHRRDQLVARDLARRHLLGGRDIHGHGIDDILPDRGHAFPRGGGKGLPHFRHRKMRPVGTADPCRLPFAARLDDLVLLGKSRRRDAECRQKQRNR